MEKEFYLETGEIELEARLYLQSERDAVVITHPHPLYGGDMYNPVVAVVAKAYQQNGWTTLRFNFRGAGRSGGKYDDGKGEQIDIHAAVEYLRDQGYANIDLGGYSFGAWILARYRQNYADAAHRIIMVAPPVDLLNFKDIKTIAGLERVIAGSEDEFAPPDQIRGMLPVWNTDADLHIIKDGDHFLWEHFDRLNSAISEVIRL